MLKKMKLLETNEKVLNEIILIKHELKLLEMLNVIDKYLNSNEKTLEKLNSTIAFNENLSFSSDKLELPLKIKGKMLGVGRHKLFYYTEEELIKAVEENKNKIIKLKMDHRHLESSSTIGKVDRIYWDPESKFICYEAHINDETQARNVLDALHTEVSASILSTKSISPRYGLVGVDLEFPELSIVEKGACSGNTLEVA